MNFVESFNYLNACLVHAIFSQGDLFKQTKLLDPHSQVIRN